jgi:hypothetical protein
MRAPRVAVWQISHLYSISAHTLNKLKVNAATTALILLAYSGKVAANSGTSFMYPKRKNKESKVR